MTLEYCLVYYTLAISHFNLHP